MEQEAESTVPAKSGKFRGYRDELYPPDTMEVDKGNLSGFFKFMHSRHRVWRNRFIKKLPREQWANHNKILAQYKYTNIYRQLDRGTLWCLEFIVKPYRKALKALPPADIGPKAKAKHREVLKNLIFQLVMYRLCNRIETFEKTGLPTHSDFNPLKMLRRLYKVSKIHSPMTSAHITLSGSKGFRKMDTLTICMMDAWYKMDKVVDGILNAKSGEDIYNAIRLIRCCGGFIAYEIYCDLCYAKVTKFTISDFVNIGPGCCEGIRLIFPSTKGAKSIKARLYELKEMSAKKFDELRIVFRYYNKYEPEMNQLSLRTIEHSLCEYSKYWLQCKCVGKRRMIYDNPTVSKHPNCTIGEGGDSLVIDKDYYGENFYYKTENFGDGANGDWKLFLKEHPAESNKDGVNYDILLAFITELKDAYDLKS